MTKARLNFWNDNEHFNLCSIDLIRLFEFYWFDQILRKSTEMIPNVQWYNDTVCETGPNELILYVIQLRLKRTKHEQANKTRIQNLCLVHRTRMKSHKCSSRSYASEKYTYTKRIQIHAHGQRVEHRREHCLTYISYTVCRT